MKIRESRTDRTFNVFNLVLVTLLFLIVLYPLLYVVSCSVSAPDKVGNGEVILFPKGLNIEGYKRVFREKNILIGYRNTIFYTVVGTMLNLVMTLPCAYALSKKELFGSRIVMGYLMVTMYFSGGMIPTFLLIKDLGLYNSWWVMLITNAVSVYNIIISKTFFSQIPKDLEEAAYIDGCSTTRTFIQIVLPVSRALIGVMFLYYSVSHWNSYFNAMIYLVDDNKKPLQLFLRRILVTEEMNANMNAVLDDEMVAYAEYIKHLIKYSVIIVSSLPVLILYPFLQRFFDKGILIGSLKG